MNGFKELINKHPEEFSEDKIIHNNFATEEDIKEYTLNDENFTKILTICLENDLQSLAM